MSLTLNTIKKSKGSLKSRKRIGRGNGSGIGTYSGKGLKGQNCRSGVSKMALIRIGMKHGRSALRGVPKLRGFKSDKPKNQVVRLSVINSGFKDNDVITPKLLYKKGIIAKIELPVKLVGNDKITLKNIKFTNIKMSESVKKQIGQ